MTFDEFHDYLEHAGITKLKGYKRLVTRVGEWINYELYQWSLARPTIDLSNTKVKGYVDMLGTWSSSPQAHSFWSYIDEIMSTSEYDPDEDFKPKKYWQQFNKRETS